MTGPDAPKQDRQLWDRPIPTIGDQSSAAQRASRLDSWAFDAQQQQALQEIIEARRDVRRFRPDPVPEELVEQVLLSGHLGPSVGFSQPWRFIVVSDVERRERAALLADSAKLKQAAGFSDERGAMMRDLKVAGIREAPLGIVVACDRRTPASGILGRNTFTDADLWSCAAAIENMWLTSRALGLGMGWVTLFEPAELAELVGLPEGVETLGWLCLGWPDELPPAPGLQRWAWSKRLPLADVILANSWDDDAAPAAPTSHLRGVSQQASVSAFDDADELLTAPGSLGVLDQALHRVVAAGRADLDTATLVIAAADHPIQQLGVSAFDAQVTRVIVDAAVAGQAIGASMAAANGIRTVVVDCGVGLAETEELPKTQLSVRPQQPRGDILHDDALHGSDVDELLAAGARLGAELASEGFVTLGEIGIGNTTVAATLAAALLGLPAEQVVGLGTASDSEMVARKAQVVNGALARIGLAEGQAAPSSVSSRDLLAKIGGAEFAFLTGVVRGAASQRGIVVLDGLATCIPALLAVREAPGVADYLVAGQVSREFAHRAVLLELALEPLLDLRLRAGEGVGAVLATSMLISSLTARRNFGRTKPL